MRISKKVRGEAALICGIAALSAGCGMADWSYFVIRQDLDASDPALELAVEAFKYAMCNSERTGKAIDAEAESLPRSGWSPGDAP